VQVERRLEVDATEQTQHTLADLSYGRHDYHRNAGRHHGVFDRRGATRVPKKTG
jgi:hypothetical protein